jgi:tRNA pseudouridine55 synthase
MTGPSSVGGNRAPTHSGFLNVNKDRGATSTGVVRHVRRLTGQRKVGHCGTLDPDATGVLPICVGYATRFAEAVVNAGKAYSIRVRLGVATDTYDGSGTVVREVEARHIGRQDVEAVLGRFRGEIDQLPPMYSAIKVGGRPLYELARAGATIERAPRRVTVSSLELVEWDHPDFVLSVECGRGFYARSLANDIGEALGNAAHMAGLERRRAGPFRIEDSITMDGFERMVKLGNWPEALRPADFVLQDLPSVVLDPLSEEQLRHGQAVPARDFDDRGAGSQVTARMYSVEGVLLALARYDPAGPWWRPEKVVVAG